MAIHVVLYLTLVVLYAGTVRMTSVPDRRKGLQGTRENDKGLILIQLGGMQACRECMTRFSFPA